MEISYKGYVLRATSYELTDGTWLPRIVIREDRKSGVSEKPITYRGEQKFVTKEEADKFSVSMGKQWIDERG